MTRLSTEREAEIRHWTAVYDKGEPSVESELLAELDAVRQDLAGCQEQFRARVDASDNHDRNHKLRIAELESQVEAIRQERDAAAQQKIFDQAFADKLKEFDTVGRLAEEYSAYKMKCRAMEATLNKIYSLSKHIEHTEELRYEIQKVLRGVVT